MYKLLLINKLVLIYHYITNIKIYNENQHNGHLG